MKIAKIILALALTLPGSLPAGLHAQTLYVALAEGNPSPGPYIGCISEYGFDGKAVNTNVLATPNILYNPNLPGAMAISGGDLCVINNSNTLAEYRLDGTPINTNIASGLSTAIALGIAGANVFVGNQGNGNNGSIGEYTLAGQKLNAALISGITNLLAMVVSGTNLFVATYSTTTFAGAIAEYTTTGQPVTSSLIPGIGPPLAMAIDGTNLYIASANIATEGVSIGKYTTAGQTVNASLFSFSGLNPIVLAASGTNLFALNFNAQVLDKYSTSGTLLATLAIPLLSVTTVNLATAPPPTLGIAAAGNQNVLYYPDWGTGYTLQQTTNLASTNWVTVSNTAPIAGVIVTNNSPATYYRLLPP